MKVPFLALKYEWSLWLVHGTGGEHLQNLSRSGWDVQFGMEEDVQMLPQVERTQIILLCPQQRERMRIAEWWHHLQYWQENEDINMSWMNSSQLLHHPFDKVNTSQILSLHVELSVQRCFLDLNSLQKRDTFTPLRVKRQKTTNEISCTTLIHLKNLSTSTVPIQYFLSSCDATCQLLSLDECLH